MTTEAAARSAIAIAGPDDIQTLVLSSPPFCLKIKPNNKINQTEQLSRVSKFEDFVKDYLVRYEANPSTCTGLEPKRTYFVKPECTLSYQAAQDLFARSLETFQAHSRSKGFHYAIISGSSPTDEIERIPNQKLPIGRVAVMPHQPVDAALLSAKSALILDFKPKKQSSAAKSVNFDTFLERVATFEKTFKDIFIRLDCPVTKKTTIRYTMRKDLGLPEDMERRVFAHAMHHCNLYKARCFRLRGVSTKGQHGSPSKGSSGGSSSGLSGLLAALAS